MNILYIHQYFRTPKEGGSTRSYELAKGLMEKGHRVIMITAHNQKKGIQTIDGIEVHYLKIPYRNDFGLLRRIFAFLRFVQLAKKESTNLSGIDLAYVMTTPLTTGLIALYLKNKYQIPFIFEVGDLWPKAPIQMGVFKNKWLIKRLYAWEKEFYQEAESVIALSPAIESYIRNIIPEKGTHVIPNLSDCEYFQPSRSDNQIFQIGYFGTFGKANGLDQLMELAQQLDKKSFPVQFTLMGEGAEENELRKRSIELSNVKWIPFGNKQQVKKEMKKMDAVYISFLNLPILNTGSPNKLFDGLAAGKMIIINFQGWIKELIESEKCGFSHDPERPEMFIGKISSLLDDKRLLRTYQQHSRKLAESQFDKKKLIGKLNQILEDAI